MNPQGGEGNKLPQPTASIDESNVGASSNPLNPLAGLGDVVNAAREAAADQATMPVEPTAQTPKDQQFASQFGEAAPPVEPMATTPPTSLEPAHDLMGQAPSNLETPQQTQPEPVVPGPELTSAPQPEEGPDPQQEFKNKVAKAAEELLEALGEKNAA